MEPENLTEILEFVLLGISKEPDMQSIIFGLFLSMYLTTVLGNLLIILATVSDPHLHTPMYFFLANLSLTDICFISTTIPKMLVNIQMHSKVITYQGCLTQLHFRMLFVAVDDSLVTVMTYGRFVAICYPLHYTVIMNPRLCGLLVLGCWVISALHSLLEALMVFRLSYCANTEIPHFFCELNQLIQLSCSDTFVNNLVLYFETVLLVGGPAVYILYSYSRIIYSIRQIPSTQGKHKAFSTCVSHLIVVYLFYGTSLGVYFSSAGTHGSHEGAIASVMNTVVTPMLNPFIYSLRNKDLKSALRMIFGKKA